jgi:hypothetical protein
MRDWYISTHGAYLNFIYDNSGLNIAPENSNFQIRTDGNVYIKNLETKSTSSLVTTDTAGKLNKISLKPGLKLTLQETAGGTILYTSESENIELTRDNEIITNNYTEHYLWNFYEEELFKNPSDNSPSDTNFLYFANKNSNIPADFRYEGHLNTDNDIKYLFNATDHGYIHLM